MECRCRCPSRRSTSTASSWSLSFRRMLPVEEWNAQISLLTGMAAASLMVYARVGLLRTLPPPDPRDVQRLHRTAKALRIEWPAELLYPDFIRSLDPGEPEPRRDDRRQHPAAARVRLRRLQRRDPRAAGARRARLGVRPRDRAAATARRPVRRRGLPRAVRRDRGARRGCSSGSRACPRRCRTRAAAPTSTSGRCSTWSRPPCSTRTSVRRSPGVVVQVDEEDPTRGDVVVQRARDRGARVTSARRPAAGHRRRGPAGRGRRRHQHGPLRARLSPTRASVEADPGLDEPTGPPAGRAFGPRPATPDCSRMSRPGGRGEETRRGRSGLHRARWWVTPTRGDPRDSATENRPPPCLHGGKGETVV